MEWLTCFSCKTLSEAWSIQPNGNVLCDACEVTA